MLILTDHLDFGAALQQGAHSVPDDAAVESSVGAVQRGDHVPLTNTHTQERRVRAAHCNLKDQLRLEGKNKHGTSANLLAFRC